MRIATVDKKTKQQCSKKSENILSSGKTVPFLSLGSKPPKRQKSAKFPMSEFPEQPMTFVRQDWTDFRDAARICSRAGVKKEWLPKLVVKELTDNALDATGAAQIHLVLKQARPEPSVEESIAIR